MSSPRGFCAGGIGGMGTPRGVALEGGEGGARVTAEGGPVGDGGRELGGERSACAERAEDAEEWEEEEEVRRSGAEAVTGMSVPGAAMLVVILLRMGDADRSEEGTGGEEGAEV